MAAEPQTPYRLVYTGLVRDSLRAMGEKAKQRGLSSEFGTALQAIENRLRSDPLTFGEKRSNLDHLDLQVRVAGSEYVYVRFAVDADRRIVYVLHRAASARLAD